MCAFRRVEPAEHDSLADDRKRHREKLREVLRENIPNIIADHSIIDKSGDTIIRIPIRGIKEHRFVYDSGDDDQGEGEGSGSGEAGDQAGQDIYDLEITLAELTDILFEELELPDLARKALRDIVTKSEQKIEGIRIRGIRPRLSKKVSCVKRVRRRQISKRRNESAEDAKSEGQKLKEKKKRFPFHKDDLRYRHVVENPQKESNAVVFFIMDVSGSMRDSKKFLVRSLAFLIYRFLKFKYQNVATVFISHHTEAKEVDENTFFHKGESGGTFISSGLKKALEIIGERFSPDAWNIYTFYSSDGENFDSDNEEAVAAMNSLTKICNLVCYTEVNPADDYSGSGSMLAVFEDGVREKNFKSAEIGDQDDLWPTFKKFLTKDDEEEWS